jgi:class 3 adenylate cyclase
VSRRVEPERAMITIVVVDIRGFTTLTDRSTAREAGAYPSIASGGISRSGTSASQAA